MRISVGDFLELQAIHVVDPIMDIQMIYLLKEMLRLQIQILMGLEELVLILIMVGVVMDVHCI